MCGKAISYPRLPGSGTHLNQNVNENAVQLALRGKPFQLNLQVEHLSGKGWDWRMNRAALQVGVPTGQASTLAAQAHHGCATGVSDAILFSLIALRS
jgi:hypothetical protein